MLVDVSGGSGDQVTTYTIIQIIVGNIEFDIMRTENRRRYCSISRNIHWVWNFNDLLANGNIVSDNL